MYLERKMARWTVAALIVLVVVGVAALPQPQDAPRVAFVSTEVILRQTPGYRQADSTFTAEMEGYRKEVEILQRNLDSAVAQFDQQSVVLSPTARQERMQELRRMQQQFEQRSQELSQRAQDRRQQLVAPLEDRIQRVIDGLRAERNLAMVFDVSSPANSIVSADPTLDLTPLVIRRLSSAGQ